MAISSPIRVQFGRKLSWMLAIALATAAFTAQSAHAIILVPGDEDEIASGEAKPVGGVIVAGGVPVPFIAKTFTGSLTTTVISGDTSNKLGGLTFTYQFTNDAKSPNAINRLTVQDLELALFATDVSYQDPGAGVIPTLEGRPTADVIGWTWIAPILGSGVVAPGTTSALLVLQTNANFWKPIVANVIDGSTANPASFGPTVPEPSTLALAGLGAIGLLVGLRRPRSR